MEQVLSEKTAPEAPPAQLGPYKHVRTLGQGGMGTVYLCEQEHPIRRQVAVKLVRAGLDSSVISQRFELEREALERMEHPGIARLLDAGTSEAGRPYFVMEFVDGLGIVEHCDKHSLDIRGRLRLIAAALHALQHAHLRGVLHRDLKPSNILVSCAGAEPQPKIIDFGLARAVDPTEEQALATQAGQLLGTPAYMSPEQLHGRNRADVDVRSDVYSMGVLLFELLSGRLPFESSAGGAAALLDRLQQGSETPTPSSRAGELDADSSERALRRSCNRRTLKGTLKGELDWIVMRAMAPDREHRYTSAAEFAEDIEAFLVHRPLLAGPPKFSYRARKYVRRHLAWMVAASLVSLSMLIGTLAATRSASEARLSEQEARSAEARMHDALDNVTAQNDVLYQMMTTPDPRFGGRDAKVADLMMLGSEYATATYSDRPAVMTEVMGSLGGNFRELGMYPEAERHLRLALEYQLAADGEAYGRIAFKENGLAILLKRMGRLEEAEELYRSAIAHNYLTPDGMERSGVGAWELNLAKLLIDRGKLDEAKRYLADSRESHLRIGDVDGVGLDLIRVLNATLSEREGDIDAAEQGFRESIEHLQTMDRVPMHFVLSAKQQLGAMLSKHARVEEGLPLLLESLSAAEELWGESSPIILPYYQEVALAYVRLGKPLEGAAAAQAAMQLAHDNLPPGTLKFASIQHDYAAWLIAAGRRMEAKSVLFEVREVYVEHLPEDAEQRVMIDAQLSELSGD